LADLVAFAVSRRLGPASIARSTLPGASGNVEFFLHLRPAAEPSAMSALATERKEAVHAPVR